MNKGYVTESRGIRLLEAQIATGGLIDPKVNHRVPIPIAYERGIINKKMFTILTDPSDDTKVNLALQFNNKLLEQTTLILSLPL